MKNLVFNSSPITVGEWVDEFLDDYVYPVAKPSAAEHYEDNLKKHFVEYCSDLPLAELTTPILQKILNDQSLNGNLRTGGPLSPKSLRNLRTAISACMTQAVVNGLIPCSPVTGTVIKRGRKPNIETMSDESREALLEFVYTDPNLMNAGIVIGAELALRRGEICALRWADFDEESGYLHIRNTVKRLKKRDGDGTELVINPVKTDCSERSLALPPALHSYLLAQKERFRRMFGEPGDDDFIVFNSAGRMTDPDNLSHYFSDLLAARNLPHIKLHALRHTLASKMVEEGIDIDSVSGILGHSSVTTTTEYYLKPRQKGMNEALWRMSGTSACPPKELPCVVRGRVQGHVYRRRRVFDAGEEKAV